MDAFAHLDADICRRGCCARVAPKPPFPSWTSAVCRRGMRQSTLVSLLLAGELSRLRIDRWGHRKRKASRSTGRGPRVPFRSRHSGSGIVLSLFGFSLCRRAPPPPPPPAPPPQLAVLSFFARLVHGSGCVRLQLFPSIC